MSDLDQIEMRQANLAAGIGDFEGLAGDVPALIAEVKQLRKERARLIALARGVCSAAQAVLTPPPAGRRNMAASRRDFYAERIARMGLVVSPQQLDALLQLDEQFGMPGFMDAVLDLLIPCRSAAMEVRVQGDAQA